MALSNLIDLTKVQILSVGTGTLLLGPAVAAFRGVEALIDGGLYSYSIQQGANYELGQGQFNAGAVTLTRGVVISSYGNTPIPLSPNGILTFTVFAVDLRVAGPPGNPGAPGGPGSPGSPGNPGTVIGSANRDPVVGDGAFGDFWINLSSSILFGPKGATWPATGISLKGDYSIAGFAATAIGASEILTDHAVARACTLQANLASSQASVGTPPLATYALNVLKNGTSIGSISIAATTGVVTLTTVGGTAVALAAGDVVTVQAPAGTDANIARLRYTLRGI